MPDSLDPSAPAAYRRRARVITAYGLISFLVGVAGLIDRSLLTTSSVVQTLDGWVVVVWLSLQAIGGALAAFGVLRLNPKVELAGVQLLLGFVVLNAITILVNRGPVGGGITAASMMLVAYVLRGRVGDLHYAARMDRRRINLGVPHDRRRVTL